MERFRVRWGAKILIKKFEKNKKIVERLTGVFTIRSNILDRIFRENS